MRHQLYLRLKSRFVKADPQTVLERDAFKLLERMLLARFVFSRDDAAFSHDMDLYLKEAKELLHRAYDDTGYVCMESRVVPFSVPEEILP